MYHGVLCQGSTLLDCVPFKQLPQQFLFPMATSVVALTEELVKRTMLVAVFDEFALELKSIVKTKKAQKHVTIDGAGEAS